LTLPEVKKYISIEGHLPGIPSSLQMTGEKLDVGEMGALLLQKDRRAYSLLAGIG